MATKAKASAAAPAAKESSIPKGMTMISGGFADTWDVTQMDTLQGTVAEAPKTVKLTQGKKQTDRRCVEVRTDADERYTVWESAALAALFDAISEKTPCKVWIHFRGYGTAKKGQNAPKLFDSAIG